MPFIEDENIFKAVSFASSLIKKGRSVPIACKISSKYYDVNEYKILSEIGKRGASVKHKKF